MVVLIRSIFLSLKFISSKVTHRSAVWGGKKTLEKVPFPNLGEIDADIMLYLYFVVNFNIGRQQMITGVSLLTSALLQLRSGITIYHWQIVVYLVWFSSFTHLATLRVLWKSLAENPPIRWWRETIMRLIVGGNVIAILPTDNARWLSYPRSFDLSNCDQDTTYPFCVYYCYCTHRPAYLGIPEICLFLKSLYADYIFGSSSQWGWMGISTMVLFTSYATRVIYQAISI